MTASDADRTVDAEVYVREPGPEVTEVEDDHGYRIPRTMNGFWLGRPWDEVVRAVGPMHPVGTRARLRAARAERDRVAAENAARFRADHPDLAARLAVFYHDEDPEPR